MRKPIRLFHPILYMFILILITPIYTILNQSTEGAVDVTISIDSYIPFVKEFIIPYLLWYPFIYGTLIYYCFVDQKKYTTAILSIIIGKLISFVIYFFWQSTVPRPDVVGDDIFSNLVLFIYNSDQPVNCLPSIHVMTTFVLMIVAHKRKAKSKWEYLIISVTGTLIILSTMFTKQHAILDVISGMMLAGFLYAGISFAKVLVKRFQLQNFKTREQAQNIHQRLYK